MSERTVLVTGAAGFIGSHVTEALLARGDRVIGLDNFDPNYDPALKRANLATALAHQHFALIEGDIRDPQALAAAFDRGAEAVIHLAAKGGVRASLADPEGYYSCNVLGTVAVLEAAASRGVSKIVFGSSSSVYGATNTVPFSEDQPTDRPISPYAATKCAAELACYTWHHLYETPTVCLRFFTVYGPRQRPDLAICRFVRMLREGQAVPRFGDGASSRDYTYVADIARGVLAALDVEAGYEAINLGNSSPVTLAELIELVGVAAGVEPVIEEMAARAGDVPRTYADVAKARRLLDWAPEWSMAEGLREFVAWYDRTFPC